MFVVVACCSLLLVVRGLLAVVYRLIRTDYYVLVVVRCWLSVGCCLLFDAFVVCYSMRVLLVACCLISVAC